MVADFHRYTAAPRDDLWEKRALQTSNAETSLAGTQTHTHTRRLVLIKSMSISVKTVSGPQLFIFLAHELMGGDLWVLGAV